MKTKPKSTRQTLLQKLIRRLLALPEHERGMIYAKANAWEWPAQMADLKPKWWDGKKAHMRKYRSPEMEALLRALKLTTSDFAFSRAWAQWQCNQGAVDHAEDYVRRHQSVKDGHRFV